MTLDFEAQKQALLQQELFDSMGKTIMQEMAFLLSPLTGAPLPAAAVHDEHEEDARVYAMLLEQYQKKDDGAYRRLSMHDVVLCWTCKRMPGKAKPLLRCKNCHRASYCDRNCQRKHWRDHKALCPLLAERNPQPSDLKERRSYRAALNDIHAWIRPREATSQLSVAAYYTPEMLRTAKDRRRRALRIELLRPPGQQIQLLDVSTYSFDEMTKAEGFGEDEGAMSIIRSYINSPGPEYQVFIAVFCSPDMASRSTYFLTKAACIDLSNAGNRLHRQSVMSSSELRLLLREVDRPELPVTLKGFERCTDDVKQSPFACHLSYRLTSAWVDARQPGLHLVPALAIRDYEGSGSGPSAMGYVASMRLCAGIKGDLLAENFQIDKVEDLRAGKAQMQTMFGPMNSSKRAASLLQGFKNTHSVRGVPIVIAVEFNTAIVVFELPFDASRPEDKDRRPYDPQRYINWINAGSPSMQHSNEDGLSDGHGETNSDEHP